MPGLIQNCVDRTAPALTNWRRRLRVLIADDEPKVRSALRLMLQHEQGVYVAPDVTDAKDLEVQLEADTPDVLLLDWEFQGIRPDKLLPALRVHYPALKVVALSGQLEARIQSIAAGVDAFVSKGDNPDVLLSVLRAL